MGRLKSRAILDGAWILPFHLHAIGHIRHTNLLIAATLFVAVLFWGGNNAGTKFIVKYWPPVWTGGSRFFLAGLLLILISRFAPALGEHRHLGRSSILRLWLRPGLSLAVYIVVFNYALRYTSASHIALYLGASPVWALLWEGWPQANRATIQRYAAAAIALSGVVVLFLPALRGSNATWLGEALGLGASVLWTNYGRQCKHLSLEASPLQVSAHSMWMAGVLLLPFGISEIAASGLEWRWDVAAIQFYCITFGGVVAFAFWTNALKHWKTSQVLLFNNLIPLSTMGWAAVFLGERVTPTFWLAMALVLCGVLLGRPR